MKTKIILITVAAMLFISMIYYIVFSDKKTIEVKVNSVERIEKVSSDNGKVKTDIYYLVMTDNGTYMINIEGIFANPSFVGILKKDSSYSIEVCGVEAPMFGMYKSILKVNSNGK